MKQSTAKYHGIPGDFANQCEASVSNGSRRCRRAALDGANTCETHGAKAPQVKRAAHERLAALVSPAIAKLKTVLDSKKNDKHVPIHTQVQVARDVLDRTGFKAKDELFVRAEFDVTRFSEWSEEDLMTFIALARRASTIKAVGELESGGQEAE